MGKDLYIEGRCNVAEAVSLYGALDARDLYPDYKPSSPVKTGPVKIWMVWGNLGEDV